MASIRILLADDHVIMRNGLRLLLERQPDLEVVGEAADGREAVDMAAAGKPNVVVMDVAMPRLNGVEATRQIVTRNPETSVVILSMHSDESYVLRSLKAGAQAYLLKDSAESDLISAIYAVTSGKSFFSPGVRKILKEDYVYQLARLGAEDSYELPDAARARGTATGGRGQKQLAEIAALLNLSLYTVETHRTHVLQKLNLHSVPELVLYAVRKGIIS